MANHFARKDRDDASTAARGTLAGIGREEETCVLITRAFDQFDVLLIPHVLGKEAVHAIRHASINARPLLRQIGFPVAITNLIAIAFASLNHGGQSHTSIPSYSVGAQHFKFTSDETFDKYQPPEDLKIETSHPRHAESVSQWLRDVLRWAWAFACYYGREWYPHLEGAAQHLPELNCAICRIRRPW